MPLIAPVIKQKVKLTVLASFKREFGSLLKDNPAAAASWEQQANIFADAIGVLVEEILTNAQVAPGIPVAGALGPGATTAPGTIK